MQKMPLPMLSNVENSVRKVNGDNPTQGGYVLQSNGWLHTTINRRFPNHDAKYKPIPQSCIYCQGQLQPRSSMVKKHEVYHRIQRCQPIAKNEEILGIAAHMAGTPAWMGDPEKDNHSWVDVFVPNDDSEEGGSGT